ncbi:MAG: hypothetical protein JRI68_24665 [Deltaproteobacteria bacterium]|nr:hypothetical protein [Deltaproteobacteria bacterium]
MHPSERRCLALLILMWGGLGCDRASSPPNLSESAPADSGGSAPAVTASSAATPESSTPAATAGADPTPSAAATKPVPSPAAKPGGGDVHVTPTKANDYCSIQSRNGVCLQHCYPSPSGKCLARPHGKLAPPPPRR